MARKTVKIVDNDGQLEAVPDRVELKQNVDKLRIKNDAEFLICWRVPDGPFVGGGFGKRVVRAIPSKAHKAAPHDSKTTYTTLVTSSTSGCAKLRMKRGKSKKRKRLSDPIIIIDVVP